MGISKNIHLVFLRKDETPPPLFKECERKIRDMHPSWDITLYLESTVGVQIVNKIYEDENLGCVTWRG